MSVSERIDALLDRANRRLDGVAERARVAIEGAMPRTRIVSAQFHDNPDAGVRIPIWESPYRRSAP